MTIEKVLEHSEHIAHASHQHDRFGTYIGVTMAILGVLLALCSALVGSERTELVHQLVEQQHAHAKYQAQDIKHRVAFLALSELHATVFGSSEKATINKPDAIYMVNAVKRYLKESSLAKEYTNSFDKIVQAHLHAQEEYEHALLLAEIGIVIASISLLMKHRAPWIISILFGIIALYIAITTTLHVKHEVSDATILIAKTKSTYEAARAANKTTAYEEKLEQAILDWANGKS